MSEPCDNRESVYVPWTFGEVFECTECGQRATQSHTLAPMRGWGADALYWFPAHARRSAGASA